MNLYFDEDSQKIIMRAKNEMFKLKHPYVGSEHLLLAILHTKSLEITDILKKYGITYDDFRNKLIDSVGIGNKSNDWFLFTPLLKKILLNATYYVSEADKMVRPYHLLLAIFKEGDGVANRILFSMNIDLEVLYDKFLINNLSLNSRKRKVLNRLAINMNQKSIDGCYEPVIGRDRQIQQLIRILLRKNKNNPLLLGEAGVGKSAIVEELAHLIAIGQVPLKLKNITIYSVSMAVLIAGTKYRGEFEEKFQKLIEEIKDDPNVVLFIDEIHTLMGAGGAEGAIDASNILKPYLARGNLKIIGATTVAEYAKYIQVDKAFDRRFQKIYVEETKKILEHLKPIYEKFHSVKISHVIIDKIISFSTKYILYGRQPDKAIDLLDEVCVYAVSKENKKEKLMNQYDIKIKALEKEKNNAIIRRDFMMAKKLKYKEKKWISKYNDILLSIGSKDCPISITLDDLDVVIYNKTNILIGQLWIDKIKSTFITLKKRILGQSEVLDKLLSILSSTNYMNKDKPLSLLFVGKNGVGKTFLSQELGKKLVGKNNCYLLYMNDFRDEQSIYKIIGPNRGPFLNTIREKPFSILIFNNIEKAHHSIISFLLRVIADGKILAYDGEEYNLSKCIFIFTSDVIMTSIGFSVNNDSSPLLKILGDKIDDVCLFKSVTRAVIKKYILNYCRDNNIDEDVRKILIDSIITNYDYKKLGFSRLNWEIEKYLEKDYVKI